MKKQISSTDIRSQAKKTNASTNNILANKTSNHNIYETAKNDTIGVVSNHNEVY